MLTPEDLVVKGKPRQSNSKLTGQPGAAMCSVGVDAPEANLRNCHPQITEGPRGRQCKCPDLCLYVPETKTVQVVYVEMIQDITHSS